MDRRSLLKSVATAAVTGGLAAVWPGRPAAEVPVFRRRIRPGDPDWPSAADWERLRKAVGGRLIPVTSPYAACRRDAEGAPCAAARKDFSNPFWVQDNPGATQTVGWVDAWATAPSVYAVEAEGAADVSAAVRFARDHNLRLVIKGGAHSYLGQSSAADSLMIWTRRMDAMTLHDDFVPRGCAGTVAPQPAVSTGSGAKFIQLYDFAIRRHGRYVQGGGCTSVGLGGHVQTGGFGSFSKYGGLVTASLLEAEVVTSDGEIRIANACTNPDLFHAIRGGGAGFGVTTRLTLATREVPERMGFLGQSLRAASAEGFRQMVGAFCAFARDGLLTPHWGEQVAFGPDRTIEIAMVWQGLSDDEARAVWAPFWRWLAEHPEAVAEASEPRVVSMLGRNWWDHDYRKTNFPNSIIEDDRPDAAPGRFWWAGNDGEVGIFLAGYESAWLPEGLLEPARRDVLADALVEAAGHYTTTLHFNKGLAGATPARRDEARQTAIHPGAIDAFALAIVAGGQGQTYPGVLGHEADRDAARADAKKIDAAYRALRRVAPDSGSYSSEMGFHEPDWQRQAWGPHYDRLLATKLKYDPEGLFTGHHQVGSEYWSPDGFTRLR